MPGIAATRYQGAESGARSTSYQRAPRSRRRSPAAVAVIVQVRSSHEPSTTRNRLTNGHADTAAPTARPSAARRALRRSTTTRLSRGAGARSSGRSSGSPDPGNPSKPSRTGAVSGRVTGERGGSTVGSASTAGAEPVTRVGASGLTGDASANGIVNGSSSSVGRTTVPGTVSVTSSASRARISASRGRCAGSGSSAAATIARRSSGSPPRSCSPRRTRSMIAIEGPRPKGGFPVPAKVTDAAQECTSDAVVASSPCRISGAR